MKKIIWLIVFFTLFSFIPEANAIKKSSIVIIDTAIDTSVVKVRHEVCLMQVEKCPNGKSFMEGPGSAQLPKEEIYLNGFGHGTMVSLVAQQTNPNIDIIFIRIVQKTDDGLIGYYSDGELILAMDWILKNRKKYNIISMSYSSAHDNLNDESNTCPTYITTPTLKSKISTLKKFGIPSFFPTGNSGNKNKVSYPACLPEGIAVGALNEYGQVESYSNEGEGIDLYMLGNYYINNKYLYGTSYATAAASAIWAKYFLRYSFTH